MLRLLKKKTAIERMTKNKERDVFRDFCKASGNDRTRRVGLSIVPFHIATGLYRPFEDVCFCKMDETSIFFYCLIPVAVDRYSKLTIQYKNVPVGEVCGVCFIEHEGVAPTERMYGIYIDWDATSLLDNGLSEYDYNRLGMMVENRLLRPKESVILTPD